MTPRALCCSLCCLLFSSPLLLAPAVSAQEKKDDRPSQEAVLAKNTDARLKLAYGKDDKQNLDVYAPKGAKNAPVVIFIHGGEWTKGDKADVSFKPKFFNEHGVVFVSINYRLSPAVTHPAHVSDVAAAIRWVHDHAADFGAAPDKIVIMGHSAGCHLAALVALDPRYLAKEKLTPRDLRGVVCWSGGMYDLVDRAKGEGNYPKYIRQTFGEAEEAWRDASPVAHVGDGPLPPFLFAYVERKTDAKDDRVEPSVMMAEKIRKAKGMADVHRLEGRTHFEANHLIGAPDDTTGKLILDFVQRVTR
jgi:acetyl esterase/lipase